MSPELTTPGSQPAARQNFITYTNAKRCRWLFSNEWQTHLDSAQLNYWNIPDAAMISPRDYSRGRTRGVDSTQRVVAGICNACSPILFADRIACCTEFHKSLSLKQIHHSGFQR